MINMNIKRHKNSNLWSRVISSLFCSAVLLLCLPGQALAATVTLQDNAHVLDASKVQAEATLLSDPVDIYTTATFDGTTSTFDQNAQSLANQHSDHIIIDIDTKHRHLAIEGGVSVPLSYEQYNDAVTSFRQNIHGNDYTSATIAALGSLQNTLTAASTASSSSPTYTPNPSYSYTPSTYTSSSRHRSGSSGLWIVIAIVMVIIAVGSRLYRAANGIPEPPSTYHHHYSDSSWNDSSSSSSSWNDSSSSSSSWSDSSSSSSSSWSDNSSSGSSSDFGGGNGASGNF